MNEFIEKYQIDRFAYLLHDQKVRVVVDVEPTGTHSKVQLVVKGVKDGEKFDLVRHEVEIVDLERLGELFLDIVRRYGEIYGKKREAELNVRAQFDDDNGR